MSKSEPGARGIGHRCKAASLRAYRELRALGRPDRFAFEAAVIVFRYHRPTTPAEESTLIVANWIDEAALSGPGPAVTRH